MWVSETPYFCLQIARGRSSEEKREIWGFFRTELKEVRSKQAIISTLIELYLLTLTMVMLFCNNFLYAGIFVGGNKVVHFTHFTPDRETSSSTETSSNSYDGMSKTPSCQTYPDCGFRQPKSGVVLSCLDCFLRNGTLYTFEYGVTPTFFLAKVRGGTCTTATSDGPGTVIHRAMYLLQNGFGNYDVFQNNCEDFALYCKTGILTIDKLGIGRSGQASSLVGAPLAALLSSPFKFLIPSPVGVATVTAGMYCMSRYATDIGVRTDIVKVAVEDLAVNLGWMDGLEEEFQENKASSENKNQVIHVD
ncbi:LRAT-like domain-containing protein [Cynara cardunculus var. scolymus]|uniref:LRAT-like domain-containing protein n=1 Tax=Cynara cardunculus var. scolymus TaxID=59895 RepID=A0A103XE14_CYNCS|nr:LRAT-like domain-containing protein [Cynara cardunculus var. scolymus]